MSLATKTPVKKLHIHEDMIRNRLKAGGECLDNRLLLAFVVVSQEKSFTRAAERLRVSQPRISLLIRKLEKMLGFDLFRRTSRHVELTEHGNIFLPAALAVCAADDAAERLARSLREEERMRVRFGAPFYTATIPERVRIVDEYLSRAPTAKLEIHNGLTPSMIRQLHEGELDIVLASVPIENDEGLEVVTVARANVMLGLPSGHPLLAMERVPAVMLKGQKVVVLPRRIGELRFNLWYQSLIEDGADLVEAPDMALPGLLHYAVERKLPVLLHHFRGAPQPAADLAWRPLDGKGSQISLRALRLPNGRPNAGARLLWSIIQHHAEGGKSAA